MGIRSKRALRTVPVGTAVRATVYAHPNNSGVRRIERVQTNGWAMRLVDPTPDQLERGLGEKLVWTYFESNVECVFDAAGFTMRHKGEAEPFVRYDWVQVPA